MIRVKCPKCSHPLTAEDDEAGGVGECEECGAKFRIPAAKSKPVAARAGAKKRADDDEDEEDDEDDDDGPRRRVIRDDEEVEDDDESGQPRKKKASGLSRQSWITIFVSCGGVFVAVVLFFASLFIMGAGLGIGIFGYGLWLLSALGLMLRVWHDNAMLGMAPPITLALVPAAHFGLPLLDLEDMELLLVVLLVGANLGATIVGAVKYWNDVRQLAIVAAFAILITGGALLGGWVNEGWKVDRRKQRMKELFPTTITMRHLDVVPVHGTKLVPDQSRSWSV
jgi:DNA-directed RNA polymerase subunit M/transcription elongation factor TFIIS